MKKAFPRYSRRKAFRFYAALVSGKTNLAGETGAKAIKLKS